MQRQEWPCRLDTSTPLRFLIACIAFAWMSGCGGGGNGSMVSRSAAIEVRVAWPERGRSRMIPVAAESIQIVVSDASGFSASRVIVRPKSFLRIENLPTGTLTVEATAHPDADPAGTTPQASAHQSIETTSNQAATLSLSLESTIAKVIVEGMPSDLRRGGTGNLDAHAANENGDLVLTNPSTWNWESSQPDKLALERTTTGVSLRALAAGTSTVTVVETESGKSATAELVVKSPRPTLTLMGPAGERKVGDTATLAWDSTDAVKVVSSNFGATQTAGSTTVRPVTGTTYTLTVANDLGETVERTVRVDVATVGVSLTPGSGTVDIRKTLKFASEVVGAVDTSVIWSVVEAGGGTITQDGTYTAPAVQGTYHVKAVSKADPTKSATSAVRVRASGGSIVID